MIRDSDLFYKLSVKFLSSTVPRLSCSLSLSVFCFSSFFWWVLMITLHIVESKTGRNPSPCRTCVHDATVCMYDPASKALPLRILFLSKKRRRKNFRGRLDHTTAAMSLYLGLVLSGERFSSMAFLLLLPDGLGDDCCWWCWTCCCCCCWCFCDLISSSSRSSSCFSCSWSLGMAFIMWGLSLFRSDCLTGFKKNSSAPSSKHLEFKQQSYQMKKIS